MSDARSLIARSRRAFGHHVFVQLQTPQSATCPYAYASECQALLVALFMVRTSQKPRQQSSISFLMLRIYLGYTACLGHP
jgi:hypothetical protein